MESTINYSLANTHHSNAGTAESTAQSKHSGHSDHSGHDMQTMTQHMSHDGTHHSSPNTHFYNFENIGLLIVFSIIAFIIFMKGLKRSAPHKNILKSPLLMSLVRSRYFLFCIRLIPAFIFVLVILAGIWGSPTSGFSAGITWLFWWTLLIFFIAFAGKVFCTICPWDFFANLFQFGGAFSKNKFKGGLQKKWPKFLSNIYPAIFLFFILTWLELGFEITQNSYVTAVLGLCLVGGAILCALVFEKRSFCRYMCPIGRVSGMYAQASPLEIRPNDLEVCRTCKTKECVKGTNISTPCPTGLIPFKLKENTYCTMCFECVRSCEKKNMTLKARSFGSDLYKLNKGHKDEGVMALFMFALTFFHGLTMTPLWFKWTDSIGSHFGLNYISAFTLLMVCLLVFSFVFFIVFEKMMERLVFQNKLIWKFSYCLIPITLGYHLGHNSMHLFSEFPYLVPMVNDPFGWGWDLFSLKGLGINSWFSHGDLRYLQVFCIVIGFYFSVKVLKSRVSTLNIGSNKAKYLYFGHVALLMLIGFIGLWFVNQPMMMKSGL